MPCPFCDLDAPLTYESDLVVAFRDRYPVTEGHTLVIPRRHVETYFDANAFEKAELWRAVDAVKTALDAELHPHAYNVGFNAGRAAGQTVMHLHIHVIPRREGDVEDPRGGVRGVIPGKQKYGDAISQGDSDVEAPTSSTRDSDEHAAQSMQVRDSALSPSYARVDSSTSARPRLIRGSGDPLLPHLVAGISRAGAVDIAVAFVLRSGVERLLPHLEDVLARGGRVRLVTGDYLDGTDPHALRMLLDAAERPEGRGALELFVFETGDAGKSFHPKAYLLRSGMDGDEAFVGSSNVSATALGDNVEWNYRVVERAGIAEVSAAFEALLASPHVRPLSASWVDAYEKRRRPQLRVKPAEIPDAASELVPGEAEASLEVATPHAIQQEALAALRATRAEGNGAGLVVLATGLGKTWLSAFDSSGFKRVLFVAHREEILSQARATFRRVRPQAHFGLFTGKEKQPDADALFASIQTLGRAQHLKRFARDAFDYIVMDEFHHAAARTYRSVIDWFSPKFLLGLTATPERTDGGDLLALCAENLVYRCDIPRGIDEQLLSPFRYFGVPDDVDYAQIPWRSRRFDEAALTQAIATETRAQNALEQLREHGGKRALGFCVSVRHADYMRDFFRRAGLRAAAVHSEASSDPRALSLEQLADGELDIVFAVDVFNEGVDVPLVDTVLMLRPTESRILWLQQLGRGLRKVEGKTLNVIDYIGNHKTFLLKANAILDLIAGYNAPGLTVSEMLRRYESGELTFPPGCEITYELGVVDILKTLSAPSSGEAALRQWYEGFCELHGQRPTALEALHEGFNPRLARKSHGSWLRFVAAMSSGRDGSAVTGLTADELAALDQCGEFLDALETTPMTKSYKMLTLLGMINAGAFPGAIGIDALADEFARVAARSARTQADVGVSLDDRDALRATLEKNPITAWTGGKGTAGKPHFEYAQGMFRSLLQVAPALESALADLTRELADWRLADYLSRSATAEGELGVFKVSHSSGKPILRFDRRACPKLPEGWTKVTADGAEYEGNFVKIALNVLRRPGTEANVLPEVIRGWFGEAAGKPGTRQHVVCVQREDGVDLKPQGQVEAPGAVLHQRYLREQIPGLYGCLFEPTPWRQGYVRERDKNAFFLLVTLEKQGMRDEHAYEDRFIDASTLQWISQRQMSRDSAMSHDLRNHRELGVTVHLFVRAKGKTPDGKASPFLYLGPVNFVNWEHDNPISVRFALEDGVPEALWGELGIS